jgi:hypothetical protein
MIMASASGCYYFGNDQDMNDNFSKEYKDAVWGEARKELGGREL